MHAPASHGFLKTLHPIERLATVDEIADAVGIEPERLARGFRRAYGEPLSEYLRRIRVNAAARLLATTDEPISQVAGERVA